MAFRSRDTGLLPSLFGLLFLVPACGSRSALLGDTGIYGDGGAGGAPTCGHISFTYDANDVLTPLDGPAKNYKDIQLIPSSDDGVRMTALLTGFSSGGFSVLHSSLSPWEDWPKNGSFPAIHTTSITSNNPVIGAPAKGDRLSILAGDQPDDSGGLTLYSNLDPGESGQGAMGGVSVPGDDVTFLVPPASPSSDAAYLAGSYFAGLQLATTVFADGSTPYEIPLGCAMGQPSSAAGVASGDGWMVAVSSGEPAPPGCSSDGLGPANRIDVLFVTPYGGSSLATSIPSEGVVKVRATPYGDGMFIAWSQAQPGPDVVRAALYDAKTNHVVGPVSLGEAGEENRGVVIATVGSSLVVVRGRVAGTDGIPDMKITVLDGELNRVTEEAFVPTFDFLGPNALFGSPEGKGFVIGWIDQADGVSLGRLTRWDCAP